MSFVPKYQWLTEFKTLKCGGCDKIYLNGNAPNKFQVKFSPTVIIDEEFDGNNIADPMQEIAFTSGSSSILRNGIVFNLDLTDSDHFVNSFSFLYNGAPYCYVFAMFSGPDNGNLYIKEDYGDFTLIKVNTWEVKLLTSTLKPFDNYITVFNLIMADFGIQVGTFLSPAISVYGFPENTQVTFNTGSPITDGLCNGSGTCATWTLNNFLPVANSVCFFQKDILNGSPTNTPSIQKEFVIPADKRVIFTVNYTNNFSESIDLDLIIKDNTLSAITTLTKTLDTGTNTVTFSYETGFSPPSSFYFEFKLNPSGTEIENSLVGFCFNEVKIETINKLFAITAMMCNENLNVLFSEEYNDLYSSLITVDWGNAGINGREFQIKLEDQLGNSFTSIMYQFISSVGCSLRNYFNFKWWSDCKFSELEYSTLPFVNEVYVQGWSQMLPNDSKETIINITGTGRIVPVFDHSLEKRQFNTGLYTEMFYGTLQRAFMHKYLEIEGIAYTRDSDSKLVPKPENDQYFTGRIDLVVDGGEVINSACCCD
jgi:hypothetical protein